MQIEQVDMTPEKAKQLLKGNEHNRNLAETRIGLMASQMKQGLWQLNGETIIVSNTGRLLDGQHRLAAVVVSGATVPMMVVTGVNDDSFETINTGRSRRTSDIIGIAGQRNRFETAAVAGQVWKMVLGLSPVAAMPPQYALEVVERFPSLDGWVERYKHARGARSLIGPTSIVPALVYFSDIAGRGELAGRLIDGIEKGQNLSAGDPILALRNRLINMKARKVDMGAQTCWGAFVRTIDAMEADEPMFQVQASKSSVVAQPKRFKAHVRNLDTSMKLADLVPAASLARIRNQKDIIEKLLKA